jgi:citrate lyase acyl carrier protein
MEILKPAVAGTLESSDVQVQVSPNQGELELFIDSTVMNQYGRQIKQVVLETLQRLGVTSGSINVVDKGALECTIKARVECAIFRSNDSSTNNLPWGGVIK